jgi:nucleotide-binding universal stress UspA family protein
MPAMKTILVPVSGGDSDQAALGMAHALASPFAAHLDFAHIHVEIADAAMFTRDIDFAQGMGLQLALRKLKSDCEGDARAAREHVEAFRGQYGISERFTTPFPSDRVTASWQTIDLHGPQRLIALARQHDLVIMARSSRRGWRSRDLMERVLVECGRPILLVPCGWNAARIRTIAVWWKDHAAAARAVTAAMPLLAMAERVSFLTADEGAARPGETGSEIARELGWHGIEADARQIPKNERPIVDRLWWASLEQGVDVVVMGAFSHSRTRELIFGGCTQSVLEAGDLPVLLLH